MSIIEHGLFSTDISDIINKNTSEFYDLFKLSKELNHIALVVLNNIDLSKGGFQRTLATLLFQKLIISHESIIILSQYGLFFETISLLRDLKETSYILIACCVDDTFVDDFIFDNEFHRLRMLKSYEDNPNPIFDIYRTEEAEAFKQNIEEQIQDMENTHLTVKKIAERAGKQDEYESFYRYASWAVHNRPDYLLKYLNQNDNKNMKIEWRSFSEKIPLTLVTALLTTDECIKHIVELASGRIENYEIVIEKINEIVEKYQYRDDW